MAMLSIAIRNNTSNANRTYNILAEPPTVRGGADPAALPVTWHRTTAGAKAEFAFTDDLYAFVGQASRATLAPGTTIMLETARRLETWNTKFNNGDELAVTSDRQLQPRGRAARRGTFTLSMDSSLQRQSRLVVGLAREAEGAIEGPAPVAVVPLLPGDVYVFAPSLAVWVVGGGEQDDLVVQEAPAARARNAALVQFPRAASRAVVTEYSGPRFQPVEYS